MGMFNSKSEVKQPVKHDVATSAPLAPTPVPSQTAAIQVGGGLAKSVIGKDLTIVGNAFSRGEIHVNGDFQGDIQCASLVVGERANIIGNLVADEIIVGGHVEGTIKGRHVTLESNSRIDGDIYHESLAIEQGAVFAGVSYQTEIQKAEPIKPSTTTSVTNQSAKRAAA